ncbi:hypothetical protein [Burkholderia pseudomultivorans]|uniref:hypothetical protein n=1 Tax=Burkholderia pseudomultivorans TaxID=1207504 RepID=UPI000B00BDDD|nr:hypothetical protein [Burkholderia pseudomultivorans]
MKAGSARPDARVRLRGTACDASSPGLTAGLALAAHLAGVAVGMGAVAALTAVLIALMR